MMRPIVIIIAIASIFLAQPAQVEAQTATTQQSIITILNVKQGSIAYSRQGWKARQVLLAGTLITATDLVYPTNTTLLVMCPDGRTREFVSSELVANAPIKCSASNASAVVGAAGTKRVIVRRGGRQSPTIPYLIAPRATVVRKTPVDLRWNAIPSAQSYTLTVRGGGDTLTFGPLDPATVVKGSVAHFMLDKPLKPNTPYTVEICVVRTNTEKHCTTDPDWSTGENLAFYTMATPALDATEAQIIASLGNESPESLYARAVLLSQTQFMVSVDSSLGDYDDAITLLEQIIREQPKSAIASSPGLYNLLGDLYQSVSLPISAANIYKRALALAPPATESAAKAALGQAMTTPDSDQSITLYDAALDTYAQFLDKDAFDKQLATLCQQIGDIQYDIKRCTPN